MIALDQRSIEKEVDLLIKSFEPQLIANTRRDEITAFVTDTITQRLAGAIVVGCGSSSLKSYLPESDLDLVLITSKSSTDSSDDIDYLREVFDSFCEEVSQKDRGLSKYTDMCIRNIEFVNARTKVAHCLVNNVGVDLTINQTGAIASIIFLDEADSIIGKNHLLKRSILLVKAWCIFESSHYTGVAILGSKVGMLSSYAVSVLVLHLFNKYTAGLDHPFSVLRSFLHTYMEYPWETHVLTLQGPVPIQSGSYKSSGQKKQYRLAPNKFQNLTNQFQADSHVTSSTYNSGSSVSSHESRGSKSSRGTSAQQRFSIRQCNIQDPVDANNNLGISVTKSNLAAITKALKCGHQHLENLLNDYKVMTEARLAEASIATHGSSGLSETLSTPSSMANNNENFYQNSMESRMYLQNQYENSGLINGVPVRIHAIPVDEVIFENSRKGKRSQSFDSEKERPIRSRDVARLLNPVPPENLGFVGGTITSNPVVIPVSRFDQNSDASTITTPKSTSTSFVTTPRGQSESGVHTEFDSTNSQRIQNLNYITQSHIGPTFESNLLNGSSVAADQPWFLQAFFSTSCWHYMRKNTSVRCDLLDHPMQSCLSTPSVLSRGIAEENSDRPIPQDPDQRYLQFKSDVDPFVTDTARLWKAYQTAIVIRNRVCDGDFEIIGKRKSNYEDSRAKDSLIIADYAVESGVNSADISMDMESVTSIIEEPRKNDISDIVALKSKYHDLETDQSVCNPAEDTSLPQPVYTAAIPLLEPALTSRTASSPIARMDDPACDSSVITTSTAGSSSGKKSQSKPSKGRKNSKRYSLSNAVANSTAAVHLHDCKSPEGKVEHDAQSSSNGSALVEDEHSSTEEDDDDVLGKVNELMVVIYRRVKKGFNVASLCHNFDLSQLPLSARKFAKSSRKYKFSKKGFAKMISKVNISTISTALCAVALVVIVGYSLYHKTYGKSNQETIITSPNILYVNSKNLKDKNIEGGFRPAAIYSPNLFVDETDPEEIGEEIAYLNDYCNEVGSNPRSSRRVCTAKSVLYEESVDYSPGAEVNKVISVAGNSVASASFDYDNSSKASSKNKINKGSKLSHLMQPVTHWVKLGGSISFGDFSKYGSYSSKLGETEDYPEVSYQWTKDGANVSDHNIRSLSPHAQHYVNEFASDPRQKPYFTIRKSKLSDAGHYKCYKYAGNERYLIAETIIQISKEPKVRTKTSYEELPLGGSLFFSLTVDGIPPPTYQWYKNGYAVNHQTNQVLTIHRANTSHSGTYSCDIQNIAGSLLWLELTVHVQDT